MSAIVRETSEYVEMSDSITLCIVKDGAAGTSINMKTGVSSPDALPSSGASIGDSYIIDGHLWTYTGGTASDATHRNGFTDCGKVSGEAGKNNYVHVAWSNKQKNHTIDDIVLSNTDGNAYAYMGTWVSETKEDKADEAVKMAKWVYVKGDKGADGSAYDIYLSASVLKEDSTGKLNGNDTVSVTAKVVKITGGTAVQVTDTNEAYFTISKTEVGGDIVDWPSGMFTVKTFNAFGQGVKTWNFALYVGGTFLKTVTLPVVRDGKQGVDGSAATVYTIETVGNNNNSGTLEDASTILVRLDGNLKLYKTVGSEKTEDSRPPQCWRLTLGGKNLDGVLVFNNSAGNNIVSYGYSKDYEIDSNGNSAVPGSATISVYKDSSMGELLASLVIPITLNPGAIVNVDAKLGKIESTTTIMKNDMNGMHGTIETIKQGQGQISLKVQDLQNGAIDTSKPHTKSQVDFTTLSEDNFYPVMIQQKGGRGVRHTFEVSRDLNADYGTPSYGTHPSSGFSFRMVFTDVMSEWQGFNRDLRIETVQEKFTSGNDTACICPRIDQYEFMSIEIVWLRGGSKYDVMVDNADACISGIWPIMMQVEGNSLWEPNAVRLANHTWSTEQVNAQGSTKKLSWSLLQSDDHGETFYVQVTDGYLYRFGNIAAGQTICIVGQPTDSKQWFIVSWNITSVSDSKVYVDISTFGRAWHTQNPLGIYMNYAIGYISRNNRLDQTNWEQTQFETSKSIYASDVHKAWNNTALLYGGKENQSTNGVYRDRAILEFVNSFTKNSDGESGTVLFSSGTYFDVSPLYGTNGRTNVKPDLLATGIDIKSHKITATTDNFEIRNNSGTLTFSIDEDGNIVGVGNASFKGSVTAKTFTLSSDKFYVDNNGNFKLNMTNFSVDGNGNITAKGGYISFFYFDEEGMAGGIMYDSTLNKSLQGLGLSSDNISVSGQANQRLSSVFLGEGFIDSRWGGKEPNHTVHRVGSTSASAFYNYIKLEKLGNGSDSLENDPEHAALGIETQGDFCLTALGGPSLFAGMCFASNTGGSSFTADKKHCFYLCSGGTFYMPSDPPDGMLIVVIQTRDRIDFNAGNGHSFKSGSYNNQSFTSNSAGQWSLFYYNNGVWYTIYMTR